MGKDAYLGSIYKLAYHYFYDQLLLLTMLIPGINVLKALKGLQLGSSVLRYEFKLFNSKLIKAAAKAGITLEKAGEEILAKTANGTIIRRTKNPKQLEKLFKDLEEIQNRKRKIDFTPIFPNNLKKIISLRDEAVKNFGINRITRATLKGKNYATFKLKVKLKDGRIIEREPKANSGKENFVKDGSPALDAKKYNQDTFVDSENIPRFFDTETKAIYHIEESIFKNLDLAGAKIELEVQSMLRPCEICSREIWRFDKMYDAKIKVYSTDANFMRDFELSYPNYK